MAILCIDTVIYHSTVSYHTKPVNTSGASTEFGNKKEQGMDLSFSTRGNVKTLHVFKTCKVLISFMKIRSHLVEQRRQRAF